MARTRRKAQSCCKYTYVVYLCCGVVGLLVAAECVWRLCMGVPPAGHAATPSIGINKYLRSAGLPPAQTQSQRQTQTHQHVYERYIVEIPSPTNGGLKGTVFIAHACTHGAYDFWPPSELCAHCTGLAEEVAIVRAVVSAGYIAVAVNSSNRVRRCWSQATTDTEFVSSTLFAIRQEHGALSLPLFAIGTSSGTSFAWAMACRREVDGVILQVLSVDTSKYKKSFFSDGHEFPIVFNPMRRDKNTFNGMTKNFEDIQKVMSPRMVKFQECEPIPVTVSYLLGRLSFLDISHDVAEVIVNALNRTGHIDSHTGHLTIDPTSAASNWRDVIKTATLGATMKTPLIFDIGRSPLAKTLNRAWAFHEYCATYIEEDLRWMDGLIH
jgi:hypothetical protein